MMRSFSLLQVCEATQNGVTLSDRNETLSHSSELTNSPPSLRQKRSVDGCVRYVVSVVA